MVVDALACVAVDGVAIDLTVSIDNPILPREEFAFGMDVESVWQSVGGTQFTAEIFAIHPEAKLVGVLGVVLHPIVDVVV